MKGVDGGGGVGDGETGGIKEEWSDYYTDCVEILSRYSVEC